MMSDLVGGIQPVTLSDDEARRRGTQKTVLERKTPPTFDVMIEIQNKDRLVIYTDVAAAVDLMLRGYLPRIEVRERLEDGEVSITQSDQRKSSSPELAYSAARREIERERPKRGRKKTVRIYSHAISHERLERAIEEVGAPAVIVNDINDADVLLTTKAHAKRLSQRMRESNGHSIDLRILRSNTLAQMKNFLRDEIGGDGVAGDKDTAMEEAESGIAEAMENLHAVELSPQPRHIRRLQHIYVERSGLRSESKGREPQRRIVIYPNR
jgi:hypothetical protein